ncbi:MAG TPA: flagellar biosynthesis regulator FlaF [Oceanipulchritudo sp.]|nr:flagellar biosynthesis regulator FlaF [Oceanipulchritudo sp.]
MRNQLNKLYRQTQMNSAPGGRQIEVSIMEMASSKLRGQLSEDGELAWSRELDEALKFNQKMWDIFSADWMSEESKLPQELRQNLLSIGIFVKKKTFTTMASPNRASLELLIQLNENILEGLKAGLHIGHDDEGEAGATGQPVKED